MLQKIAGYYSEKIKTNGPSHRGVDWNSVESQVLRFEQLMKIIPPGEAEPYSILDFGCGYGALLTYLQSHQGEFDYTGLDISDEMLNQARSKHMSTKSEWITSLESGVTFDYIVASGVFNVKLDIGEEQWEDYIFTTLDMFNRVATRGFSFNLLTNYADVEFMTDKLYYASPEQLFAHCKQNFSRSVSLLHDYPLYEFSILVRK
ncbi:MAG: class I SAM-dependent methyltransferase [Roseivirga sp.]|nr:class I SAM-dependent methyltransferase [Roseivirga sp.]